MITMMMRFLKIAMTIRVARKCQKFTNHSQILSDSKVYCVCAYLCHKIVSEPQEKFSSPWACV